MISCLQLQWLLSSWGRKGIYTDEQYACLDRGWISSTLIPTFWKNLEAEGILTYTPNSNDCDKFALGFRAFAQELHARSYKQEAGLAFGFLAYVRDAGGCHSINFAIVKEGDEHNIMFIEPQPNGGEVTLSDTEQRSIQWFYV